MADYDYEFKKYHLFNDTLYQAVHDAVMHPLRAASSAGSCTTQGRLHTGHYKLLGMWRRRLIALRRGGWSVLNNAENDRQPDMSLQYLRNCPPYGIMRKSRLQRFRACGRARLCPYCYARSLVATVEAYREAALMMRVPRPESWCLISVVREFPFVSATGVSDLQSVANLAVTAAKFKSADYKTLVRPLGGSVDVRVDPGITPELTRIRRTTLAFMPAETQLKPNTQAGCVAERFDPTHEPVECFVARALPYPCGLMCGSVEATIKLQDITATANLRFTARYGLVTHVFATRDLVTNYVRRYSPKTSNPERGTDGNEETPAAVGS